MKRSLGRSQVWPRLSPVRSDAPVGCSYRFHHVEPGRRRHCKPPRLARARQARRVAGNSCVPRSVETAEAAVLPIWCSEKPGEHAVHVLHVLKAGSARLKLVLTCMRRLRLVRICAAEYHGSELGWVEHISSSHGARQATTTVWHRRMKLGSTGAHRTSSLQSNAPLHVGIRDFQFGALRSQVGYEAPRTRHTVLEGWNTKNVFGPLGAYTEPSPGRANSLVHLRYRTARMWCGLPFSFGAGCSNVVEQHAAFAPLCGRRCGHAGAARCQARWRLPGHLSCAPWRRLTLLQLLHMRCAAIACGA